MHKSDRERLEAYSKGLQKLGNLWLEEVEADRQWFLKVKNSRKEFTLALIQYHPNEGFNFKADI
jgi:hypothetical protein